MITVFAILSAVTAAALLYSLRMNRELARQLAALADAQAVTESRLDKISRKTRKATCKQRAFDRKLEQQRKRQDRIARTQEQMKKEQTRQAADLRKMQFKLELATADIEAAKLRLSSLYSLLDFAMSNQAAQMPGSSADYRYQKQITSLQHSISIAERQLSKARFDAQTAREVLAA